MKNIPEDDEENQDHNDQERIKKGYINEMFQRHFKKPLDHKMTMKNPIHL